LDAHFVFKELPQAECVGVVRDHAETPGTEEILCDAAPQIPHRLDGGLFFGGDERLWIDAGELAQLAQEIGGGKQTDRRLQIGFSELLAQ
jgi:hypothetical protein